jgi:hypothetical protein
LRDYLSYCYVSILVGELERTNLHASPAFQKKLAKLGIFLFLGFVLGFIAISRALWGRYLRRTLPLRKQFEALVKEQVYKQVFAAWNSSVQYLPNQRISTRIVNNSRLFRGDAVLSGDDYCHGQLSNGRPFHLSELQVFKRQSVKTSEGTRIEHEAVFKGLFFAVERTKSILNSDHPLFIRALDQSNNFKIQQPLPREKKVREPANAQHNLDILDADLAPILAPASEPKKEAAEEAVSLFDQLYSVKSKALDAREQLPEEFCQYLNYLRVRLKQPVLLSFNKKMVCLGAPQQTDFWVVNANESLLAPQRVRYAAWNFALAFELLGHLSRMTAINGPSI